MQQAGPKDHPTIVSQTRLQCACALRFFLGKSELGRYHFSQRSLSQIVEVQAINEQVRTEGWGAVEHAVHVVAGHRRGLFANAAKECRVYPAIENAFEQTVGASRRLLERAQHGLLTRWQTLATPVHQGLKDESEGGMGAA